MSWRGHDPVRLLRWLVVAIMAALILTIAAAIRDSLP